MTDEMIKIAGSLSNALPNPHSAQIRARAEQKIKDIPLPDLDTMTHEEIHQQFHELRVKQAEAEIRNEQMRIQLEDIDAQAALFRIVTENMLDLVALTDMEGYYLFAGQSHAILGYEPAFLTGKNVMDFVHPEDLPGIQNEFAEFVASGLPRRVEYRYRCIDGSYIWLETLGKFITDENCLPKKIVFSSRNTSERKQAEEELRKSLTRYDELVANVPVGVYVFWIRANGHVEFEYVSNRWCEIHQIKREDVLADAAKVNNLVHPDDRDTFLLRNQESYRKRIPFSWEGRFLLGDGKCRWLHIKSTPFVFDNGDIRWFGVTSDITERKLAEEALRENTTRARRQRDAIARIFLDPLFVSGHLLKAFDALTEGAAGALQLSQASIWLFSEDGLCLECLAQFVCQKEEHRRSTVGNIVDVAGYIEALRRKGRIVAEVKGNDWRIASIVESNGPPLQPFYTLIDTAILLKGQVIGAVSLVHVGEKRLWHPDEEAFAATIAAMAAQAIANSERKQLLITLKDREKQYRELFDNAPVGIFQITEAGRFLTANPEYARLAGYADPAHLMSRVTDIAAQLYVDPKERERYQAYLRRHGQAKNYQVELKRSNGERFWASMNTRVRHDPLHGVVYDGFLIDINEFKRSEAEREKLHEQLNQAQKLESVGRLAGGVAHDFNNMLGVILGHTEMALTQTDPAKPLYASLEAVHQAGQRSAALTQQLLAFARKQTVAPKVIDLNEALEGMLKMLRRLIGEDIDLLWKPGRNLPPVNIDPSQIDQILVNLCVNARDAIAGQGKITIATYSKTLDEAHCPDATGALPGEYILLQVSDDGCGMDQKTLSHIFEPFFTTKEQGKGTGLGLASVFGMVKQNNGFINVNSEPGQGAAFTIYLPAYAVKSAATVENTLEQPAEHGNETILLVEDEPAILKMATMMLEMLGYTVVAATSPGEAIRLAHAYRGRLDLVMTDVVMPEMNGRELAGHLFSHCPDLKCLFMSGHTANVIVHDGVLDDGVHFIQKPFSMKDVGTKLREVLEG